MCVGAGPGGAPPLLLLFFLMEHPMFWNYVQNAGLFTRNIEWEKNNSFFSV